MPLATDLLWGNTHVSPATNLATGTEIAPVFRSIASRRMYVLSSSTNLNANLVFTSQWYDSLQTGDMWIHFSVFCGQASAANGFVFQETPDTNNGNLYVNSYQVQIAGATLTEIELPIRQRFWRVNYTQGATIGTLNIFAMVSNMPAIPTSGQGATGGTGNVGVNLVGITNTIPDAVNSTTAIMAGTGAVGFTGAQQMLFNGATWDRHRGPTIFRTAQATASGNTALWTPTAGKKFRLQRLLVDVTSNVNQAAGGVNTITFQDSAAAINLAFDVFVPTTAVTTGFGGYTSGWMDLGNGILSAVANNVLNINLTTTLTSGNVRVSCCGTEE